MRITLIGTGAASGIPIYGCDCRLCLDAQRQPELRRTACSALIQVVNEQYLIDAGQADLALRFPAGSLNGILITHFHPDHVQGLFHLRWGKNLSIPVYTPPDTIGCADLYKHPGILKFVTAKKFHSFALGDTLVTPIPLIHSKPTFGYCFERQGQRIAYLTDTKGLPPASADFLRWPQLDVLFLDCTYGPQELLPGHNNLQDVFAIQSQLHAKKLVLTHIGHGMETWLSSSADTLPPDVVVARDGMVFDFVNETTVS